MAASFCLTLKRNILIEKCMWRRTLLEFFITVVMVIIITINPIAHSSQVIRAQIGTDSQSKYYATALDELHILKNYLSSKRDKTRFTLAYAPVLPFTKEIVESVAKTLQLNGTIGFNSDKRLQMHFDDRTMLAGVVFNVPNEKVPTKFSVALRFPSDFRTLDPKVSEDRLWVSRCSGAVLPSRDNVGDGETNVDIYEREGFLQLQHQIFLEWFRLLRIESGKKTAEPQIEMRIVRNQEARTSCPLSTIASVPTFLFHFVFLLPFLNLVWVYAQHVEDNVMVHEWYYGNSFKMQWFAHFIISFIHLGLLGLFVVVVVCIVWIVLSDVTINNNLFAPLIMLLFVVMYIIGIILTAMFISKLIAEKVNAVLVALALWMLNYAIFAVIMDRYTSVNSTYLIVAFVIFINNLFPFGMNLMHRYIDKDEIALDLDIGIVFASALANILIILIGLILLQWCYPGAYLSRRVVCRKKYEVKKLKKESLIIGRHSNWQNSEFGNVGSIEMIRLRNISTLYYQSDRKVIKNVSMRAYQGEIFVLVGHLGSGKMTLLRVIAGLKLAHQGSVHIDGEELYTNIPRIRKKIDFRMSENGLPDYITVQAALRYYVSLKYHTKNKSHIDLEFTKYWDILQSVLPSAKTLVKHLDYGQRRLVSTCVTLASKTPILLFDEPTAFLNLKYARTFWQLLEREKANRCIIVTTCSVDDASRVADRIGIFNVGMLEASGTPFFLRHKFGQGFELILLKKPAVSDEPITDFIKKYIPDLEPDNEIGDQLIYKIDKRHRKILQRMLMALEKESPYLGIDNLRVMGAEMSDIYMKLATSFRLQQQVIPDVTQTFKYTVVGRNKLRLQQVRAMLYKKMVHQSSNIWMAVILFVTIFLILLIGELTKTVNVTEDRSSNIDLGFRTLDLLSVIPSTRGCNFLAIRSLTRGRDYTKSNALPRLFTKKSFDCGRGDYASHMRNSETSRTNAIGAVNIANPQKIIGWSAQDVFHAAPMTLNVLHNLILRTSFPENKNLGILIRNSPMPTPLRLKINLLDNQIAHIYAPLTLGTILPFFISIFIIPFVQENMRHIRILQELAGINLYIYWLIAFIWDILTFFIFSILYVIIMTFISLPYQNVNPLYIVLLMNCFGIAALPCTYLLSMFLDRAIFRSYMISLLLQLFTGLVLYVIYWDVASNNIIFFYLASLAPGFSLLDGLSVVYIRSFEMRNCHERCRAQKNCNQKNIQEVVPECRFETFFQWKNPGLMPAITFMLISAIFTSFLIFWIEIHRRERKFFTSRPLKHLRTACYPFDDADVADVKIKIAEADMHKCKQAAFLVDQLEAHIPMRQTKLNTISFALNKYTSMGVFGARKSGKSHLVKQLIGEHGFVFGEVYVRGLDFKYDLEEVQNYLGYCPQNYGYLSQMTSSEMIRLLCMIRGVPEEKIGEKIHDLAMMLNMSGWMNRRIDNLTHEKRRKVNVAISLIAYNKILILDEPTYGMPATTRREIWNILRYVRFCGKTIIFTSTDELECKILADFILIFDNHEMLGIGSLHYVRYKYSHGFYLEVRLIRDGTTQEEADENLRKDVDNLIRYVQFLHERSEMIAQVNNWLKFYVPVENIIYSFLYGSLEKNKSRLNIFEYTVYQASTSSVLIHIQDTRAEYKRRSLGAPETPEPSPEPSAVSVRSSHQYERPSRRQTLNLNK